MSVKNRFNNYKGKIIKKVDKFRRENCFNIDWDDFYALVDYSFEHVLNEGVRFDFNDPAIRKIIMMSVKNAIYSLERGESVDILGFVELNHVDDGLEIIDDLMPLKEVLDSEIYFPALNKIYSESNKGRPNCDPVVLFNCLILQCLYGYSDEELVKWIKTKSLRWFLGFPENLPEKSTIWNFREKIIKKDLIKDIWKIHLTQLDEYGFKIKNKIVPMAQDAQFIESCEGNPFLPRGRHAKTRRSRDGTKSHKNGRWYFGYKIHILMDLEFQLIRCFEITTAGTHDSQIIFNMMNAIIYSDKGYVGVNFPGYPAFMLRNSKNPKTNAFRKKRNQRISSKRAPVERPFSSFKLYLANQVKVTTTQRTKIKLLIATILFNIKQVITLRKQENTPQNNSTDENKIEMNLKFFNKIPESIEKTEKIEKIKQIKNKRKKSSHKRYREKITQITIRIGLTLPILCEIHNINIEKVLKPQNKKNKQKNKKKAKNQNSIKKKFNRKLDYSF
jgi:IS5 family transposase